MFLSVRQLGDRRILAVLLKSMLLTLAIFAMLGMGLWFGARWIASDWFAASESVASLAAAGAILLGALGAWLLFRAIAVAVIGIFADEVVHAVEAKHYPHHLALARDLSFAKSMGMGLKSTARSILANFVFAPVYLLLLVTGIGTAIAFFLVNSWLLGRDLGEMVAARHMPAADLPRWRASTRTTRFVIGAAGTALFFIPFVNFLAPVLGAAMTTHLFHRRIK